MEHSTWLAYKLIRKRLAAIDKDQAESGGINALLDRLRREHTGLNIDAFESVGSIELTDIGVKNKGQGTGTKAVKELQEYARRVGKPIVLRPQPDQRKKAALFRFYKNLGFVINKGRKTDFTLSSPFALTMYWKP